MVAPLFRWGGAGAGTQRAGGTAVAALETFQDILDAEANSSMLARSCSKHFHPGSQCLINVLTPTCLSCEAATGLFDRMVRPLSPEHFASVPTSGDSSLAPLPMRPTLFAPALASLPLPPFPNPKSPSLNPEPSTGPRTLSPASSSASPSSAPATASCCCTCAVATCQSGCARCSRSRWAWGRATRCRPYTSKNRRTAYMHRQVGARWLDFAAALLMSVDDSIHPHYAASGLQQIPQVCWPLSAPALRLPHHLHPPPDWLAGPSPSAPLPRHASGGRARRHVGRV
jgi:hypothetical protein